MPGKAAIPQLAVGAAGCGLAASRAVSDAMWLDGQPGVDVPDDPTRQQYQNAFRKSFVRRPSKSDVHRCSCAEAKALAEQFANVGASSRAFGRASAKTSRTFGLTRAAAPAPSATKSSWQLRSASPKAQPKKQGQPKKPGPPKKQGTHPAKLRPSQRRRSVIASMLRPRAPMPTMSTADDTAQAARLS
eukprot:6775281-Prymnesium_polylepis.1